MAAVLLYLDIDNICRAYLVMELSSVPVRSPAFVETSSGGSGASAVVRATEQNGSVVSETKARPVLKSTSTPRKGLRHTTMCKMVLGLCVTVFLLSLVYLFYSYYLGAWSEPLSVQVTNVTGRSATISWVTREKTAGMVIYSEKDDFLPWVLSGVKKQKVFDDRDMIHALNSAAEEVSDRVSENDSGSISYEELQQEGEITEIGRYYVHHVTVEGLQPETEYFFMVGNGLRYVKGDVLDNRASFVTYGEVDQLSLPSPAYGTIRLWGDAENPVTDGVVYMTLNDGETVSESVSAVLGENGSWYIDLSNIRDVDGASFLPGREEDGLVEVLTIETGIYGRYEKEISLDEDAPAEVIRVQDPEIELNQPDLRDFGSTIDSADSSVTIVDQALAADCSEGSVYPCSICDGGETRPRCEEGCTYSSSTVKIGCGYMDYCRAEYCKSDPAGCECGCSDASKVCSGGKVCKDHTCIYSSGSSQETTDPGGQTCIGSTTAPPVVSGYCGPDKSGCWTGGVDGGRDSACAWRICRDGNWEEVNDCCGGCASSTSTTPSCTYHADDQGDIESCKTACNGSACTAAGSGCLECQGASTSPALKCSDGETKTDDGDPYFCEGGTWYMVIGNDRCQDSDECYCAVTREVVNRGAECYDADMRVCYSGEIKSEDGTEYRCMDNVWVPDLNEGQPCNSAYCICIPTDDLIDAGTWCRNEIRLKPATESKGSSPGEPVSHSADINSPSVLTGSITQVLAQTANSIILSPSEGLYVFTNAGEYCTTYREELDCFTVGLEGDYRLYVDANDNAVFDEGDIDVGAEGTELVISSTTLKEYYRLREGYNVISFSIVNSEHGMTAKQVLTYLNNTYQDAFYSISTHTSGRWVVVEMRDGQLYGDTDFAIIPGRGYFFKSSRNLLLTWSGNAVEDPVPVSMQEGWNLIAVHGTDSSYTASSLIDSIDSVRGLDADNVTRWDASRSQYTGLQKEKDTAGNMEVYGFDFPIDPLAGYFVRIAGGSGTWTPE
jgi:hypothetical protein